MPPPPPRLGMQTHSPVARGKGKLSGFRRRPCPPRGRGSIPTRAELLRGRRLPSAVTTDSWTWGSGRAASDGAMALSCLPIGVETTWIPSVARGEACACLVDPGGIVPSAPSPRTEHLAPLFALLFPSRSSWEARPGRRDHAGLRDEPRRPTSARIDRTGRPSGIASSGRPVVSGRPRGATIEDGGRRRGHEGTVSPSTRGGVDRNRRGPARRRRSRGPGTGVATPRGGVE